MPSRALVILLLWAGILTGCGRAERELRVVTLTDLTGPHAAFGQGIRMAAALAIKAQQAALWNAGWRVELAAFDAYGSSQDLPSAVSRIAAQGDTICAVVHTETAGNLSAVQILHTAGIPTVLPAETVLLPAGEGEREIVRLSPDDDAHGAGDAAWAAANDYAKIFLLLDSGEHAQAVGEGFLRGAATLGLSVVDFRISPAQDAHAWIPSFKSASPELVYFSGPSDSLTSVLEGLESSGFEGSFLFSENEAEDELPKDFHSEDMLLFFSPATVDSEDFSRIESFTDSYRTAYGAEPPPLSALGFDAATFCLLPLLEVSAADLSPTSPRSWIISRWRSGEAFEGITGAYSLEGGRPCRIPIFTPSKNPGALWIPASVPESMDRAGPDC